MTQYTGKAFPSGSYPKRSWPTYTWPGVYVLLRYAEIWQSTVRLNQFVLADVVIARLLSQVVELSEAIAQLVIINQEVGEDAPMNQKITDDYDELEKLL